MRKLLLLVLIIPSICFATLRSPYIFSKETLIEWRKLEVNMLLSKDKDITIIWNGIGGNVYILDEFLSIVHKIQSEGKTITLLVEGEAVSAHAIVLCYIDKYSMAAGSVVVFHTAYRRDYSGKKIYGNNMTRRYLSPCIVRGILTDTDIGHIVGQHKRLEIYSNGSKAVKPDYE